MKRNAVCTCGLLATLCTSAGCEEFLEQFNIGVTRVLLVNDGEFDVDATVAIHSNPDVSDDAIDDVGEIERRVVRPGDPVSIFRACQQLQAVKVVDAELQVLEGEGPNTSSDTVRAGQYNCGDTIVFTFDHGVELIDFNVVATTEPD